MNMRFYLNPEEKIIIQTFEGDLTLDKWKNAMQHVWSHPLYSPEYKGIVDLRHCNMNFSPRDLFDVIALLKSNPNNLTIRAKGVIMVDQPVSAALASIYTSEMKNFHDAEVFCSESTALRYLGTDFAIFDKLWSEEAMSYSI